MACHIDPCVLIHKLVRVTMNTVTRIGNQLVAFGNFQVSGNHFRYEFAKGYLWLPAQLVSRFARVTHESVHFRRPKIMWIDGNDAVSAAIDSFFFNTAASPGELHLELFGGGIHEVAHGI